MASDVIHSDMVIIGAGPVGLFAVFEAGLLGMNCHVIDNLDKIGGQCAELYPEKPIFDIPALPYCTGQELIDRLKKQAEPFDPVYHLDQQAETLSRVGRDAWRLTTSDGLIFETPNIVVAAGAGSFVPRRVPLANAHEFEGQSLHYAVRQRDTLAGKDIVIAGGGDSALDWLINLAEIANSITLVHRRDDFRAAPDSVAQMRALLSDGKARLMIGQIASITGDNGETSSVEVKTKTGNETIKCNTLLAFFGLKAELGPLADWGLNVERNHIDVETVGFETNQPGIFAIGDIATYPGKLKLILSGFHEAALMCQRAYARAYPEKKLVFRYTTSSASLHEKLGIK